MKTKCSIAADAVRPRVLVLLLLAGAPSTGSAQKVVFSGLVASGGDVHSSVSAVADKKGNVFVAGGTREGLRVTDDAFQKSYRGHVDVTGGDIFLMKLSPVGELIYSTYIGGSGSENHLEQIVLDDSGNVYVGFTTESRDLPVSRDAYQKTLKGENNHYIIKFSNDCKYLASTYLGGSASDHWTRLAINRSKLYVFGKSRSLDFPTTKRAVRRSYDNSAPPDKSQPWMSGDLTITSLSLDLDKVLSSTYWGGKALDFITAYAFDDTGKIYLTGGTYSDNFPTSREAYKDTLGGETDGFLTIIDESLSEIQYSTYVGGTFADQVNSIVVLDAENVILVGETKSPDFPVTADASTGKYIGGKSDGFVMRFSLKANKPVYSSFVGGTKGDTVTNVIMTDRRELVLVGKSASRDFPVTADALYNTIAGGMDLVILRLDRSLKNIEYATFGGGVKQVVVAPRVHYGKDDKLLIGFTCVAPDFPATRRYVEPNSQWTNCVMQIDLGMEMGASSLSGRAVGDGSGPRQPPWTVFSGELHSRASSRGSS